MSGQGHIRQRSKGSFTLFYRDGGKLRTETVRTTKKSDAQRRLRELLALVDQRRHPDDPQRLTVAEWATKWLGMIEGEVSARRHIGCETAVRVHLEPALGEVKLARLVPSHIQDFYSALSKGPMKASSARQVCSILNTMLERATELRLIANNPCDPVRKRMPKRETPDEPTILDHDQSAQLLAAAKGTDLHMPVLLGLSTGARRNEILALTWRQIALDAGELRIEHSLFHHKGASVRKAPKNGKPRSVALPPMVVEELRRLKLQQAEDLFALGVRQTSETPICTRADGTVRSPYSLSDAFEALVKRAGLPRCSFHSMRHTHASELLRAGVPVHVAARRLGHSDNGQLLLRVYAHATDEQERDAAAKIGALLENF